MGNKRKSKKTNSRLIDILDKGNSAGTVEEEGICNHEIQQQVIDRLSGYVSKTDEGITITLPITTAFVTKTQ